MSQPEETHVPTPGDLLDAEFEQLTDKGKQRDAHTRELEARVRQLELLARAHGLLPEQQPQDGSV